MPKIYFFNFDCEFTLQDKAILTKQTPKNRWYFLIHSAIWLLPLCKGEDVLIVKSKGDSFWLTYWKKWLQETPQLWASTEHTKTYEPSCILEYKKQNQLAKKYQPCLWGWTTKLQEQVKTSDPKLPELLLEKISSKLYSHTIRATFFPPLFQIPSQAVSTDITTEQLTSIIEEFADKYCPFFIKQAFGMSGHFCTKEITRKLHLDKYIKYTKWVKQGGLILEKALEGEDWSLQFTITAEKITYHGVLQNYIDNGTYKGSCILSIESEAIKEIFPYINKVALHIQQQGYIGAIGFDLFISDGKAYLLEINPRYTMGRIALEWSVKLDKFLLQQGIEKNKEQSGNFVLHTFSYDKPISQKIIERVQADLNPQQIFILHLLTNKNKYFLTLYFKIKSKEEKAFIVADIERKLTSL